MPRGRPTGSIIRQNIIELLAVIGKNYGYKIHRFYQEIFPPCTREVIYYHLRKGVQTKEFIVHNIAREQGEYSWGTDVEKIYYELGPEAKVKGDTRIEEHLRKK